MNFVFDLDGTICFKGLPVTENLLMALENLESKGNNVIFASARPIRDMLPVLDKRFHTFTMIGGNGSILSKAGDIFQSMSFTDVQVNSLKQLLHKFNATYLIDGECDYTYTGPKNHPILNNLDPSKLAKMVDLDSHKSIIKILVLTSDNMDQLLKEASKLEVVIHKHGNENVIDISPKGIHKWSALSALGVKKGEYIAFGNDANDITMFENAAYSVMIGNHPELSQHASESIPLNNETEKLIIKRLNELSKEHSLMG